jgi:Kef-type K+ transport system membrane component KefB
MPDPLTSLFVVMLVAAAAPIVTRLLPDAVPQVLVLLIGGVLIGPEVLGWAERPDIELIAQVGLGLLFLLAGYELPPLLLRQRAGRLALYAWLVSVVLAMAIVGLLELAGLVKAFVPVSLALTTTALGTLLPILRDNGMLTGPFGSFIFAAGAVGELGPVLAISVFLGANGSWQSLLAILGIAGVAYVLARLPRHLVGTRLGGIVASTQEATSQSVLRATICLLLGALLLTRDFGLDIVLGAFLAGMILKGSSDTPEAQHERLLDKLDAVAYGFFIPVFFVFSGMGLDLASLADNPVRLLVLFVLMLLVRGGPALWVYRKDLRLPERVELMLLSATALPLIIALAEIGLENGTMLPENAAALVGAGALTVAVFPWAATWLRDRHRPETAPVTTSDLR